MDIRFEQLVRVVANALADSAPGVACESVVEALLDELGERVELRTYTGHGDFDNHRIWEIPGFIVHYDKETNDGEDNEHIVV